MNAKYSFRLIVPAVLFGMVLSVPAFAQDSAPATTNPNAPASQQMKAAGQDMENAGADTVAAGTDTYHATKRAVKDTTITAEVKAALEKDKLPAAEIHVHTRAGVVTLNGRVPSPDMAAQAAQVAQQTNGVKSVNNRLLVANSTGSAY
ncbi:BON domain-containing protein [Candidatus Binatus sp.]|uniref:BON domain-containing protein n=2 Tax=Candidatus Binatus sp. TaxID=2811406 RepID=UPI003C68CE7E